MLNFLKYVFATIVGIFLFIVISVLIIAGIAGAGSKEKEGTLTDASVLRLKLDREIIERETEDIFSITAILNGEEESIGLLELKKAILHAKKNEKIKGIYLELSQTHAGFSSLEEIRNALLDFKKSGKFIVAYGESYSEGAYYLASVADKIFLPSSGLVEFNGLQSEVMFLKGTLDKLEIKAEIFKVGDYKSAVEPLFLDKMSDANRQQIRSFLNSIYDFYLQNVAISRKLEVSKLKLVSDSMLVRNGPDALKYGLVTDIEYFDKVEEFMKNKLALSKKEKIDYVSYGKLNSETEKDDFEEKSDKKVAVIFASGEINSGKGTEESIGSETTAAQIRKARENEDVKAIVLRINSPGGSALASDIIWREVLLTKGVKPIIASMSDVAASGGYYIAMACDTIVAEPNTITGSIGVFGVILDAESFMKNKLGITFDRENTGKFSDVGTMTRSLTPYEKTIIQKEVDHIYDDFTAKAAQGRKMSQDELKKVASGRVWSGTEAKSKGLVDVLGGLEDAIAIAVKKAGLAKDYSLQYLPEQKVSIWKEILSGMGDDKTEGMIKSKMGQYYPYYKSIRSIQHMNGIQARMPFELIVR